MIKRILYTLLFLQSINSFAQSSLFSDSEFNREIQESIDSIYNFNFNSTGKIQKQLELRYPAHPFNELYFSIVLYWKQFPITPNDKYHRPYVNALNMAIEKFDIANKKSPEDLEIIFFSLMSRLLLVQYYSDNDMSSKVIPYVSSTYKLVKRSFILKDSIMDFNFPSGIYNYYREYYPRSYPIYKPIAYFFPKGDAEEGLKQLKKNSEKGIFLESEARFFLVYINFYFEKDFRIALKNAKQLVKKSPDNLIYLSYEIQILLSLEKYNKAHELIPKLRNSFHENEFFIILADLFEAVIIEKKNKNYKKAELMYWDVIEKIDKYGQFANSYKSISYFGLSRIYTEKDKKRSMEFREMAIELTPHPHINFD